jgi:glycosyltransferase involved in cell wall biosynthesis
MRIGLITGEYPPMPGGVGDYTRCIAREMVRMGHEVFVLTSPLNPFSVYGEGSMNLSDSPSPQAERGLGGEVVSPTITGWNRAVFRAIPRWIGENRLDIINLQFQTAAYNMAGLIHFLPSWLRIYPAGAYADAPLRGDTVSTAKTPSPFRGGQGWGQGIPFITTFHDLRFPYLFPKAGVLRPWIVGQLARRSDGVIVTDRADEHELGKLSLRHLVRIPIGANLQPSAAASPERQMAIRRAAGAGEGDLLVAHFGFVNASKGIDTLLRGIHLVTGRGMPVKLMMIGERVGASDPTNYAYLQTIESLAADLGISLYWTGYIKEEDSGDYFAAADVVALPFKDGASLRRGSLQAALAFGCCIVTTHPNEDIPEFTDALLYIPPDDPTALADAFARLHAEPDLRQRLGQNARAAAAQFRWDQITARILAFYETVLGGA